MRQAFQYYLMLSIVGIFLLWLYGSDENGSVTILNVLDEHNDDYKKWWCFGCTCLVAVLDQVFIVRFRMAI
jgi:hypothetical protein